MGEGLRNRIRQQRFATPQQEALLNVMVAANYVREQSERVTREHGITLPQYNVLRILRGVHPSGHPRCDIAARICQLTQTDPDVASVEDYCDQAQHRCSDAGRRTRERCGG